MAAWTPHPDTERFLDLLDTIDLPGRYYRFVDGCQPADAPLRDRKADHQQALEVVGLPCVYLARERFFRHEVEDRVGRWWLHLAFRAGSPSSRWGPAQPGRLELGLYLRTPRGDLGGPVHRLAREVAGRRDPAFHRDPAAPRLLYWTFEGLCAAVELARDLLLLVREAANDAEGW